MRRLLASGSFWLALPLAFGACVRVPHVPAPGTGTLWGIVRAIPREGVGSVGGGTGGAYGDRRFRDVELVDYRRPGFVVVYVDGNGGRGETVRASNVTSTISLRPSRFGPQLSPAETAVELGATLVVANADSTPHVLACPEFDFMRRVEPGEKVEIPTIESGPAHLFVLDAPDARSLVFVAPGPYAVASGRGRWELPNLPPGNWKVHAWHPRLPSAAREVALAADQSREVDLRIGVHNVHELGAALPARGRSR